MTESAFFLSRLIALCAPLISSLRASEPAPPKQGLQKSHPSPFPQLPAQHIPLGSFLTLKGHLSYCNMHMNASRSKAFIFPLHKLRCIWECPERLSACSHHQLFSGALLFCSRSITVSLCVFSGWQETYTPLSFFLPSAAVRR